MQDEARDARNPRHAANTEYAPAFPAFSAYLAFVLARIRIALPTAAAAAAAAAATLHLLLRPLSGTAPDCLGGLAGWLAASRATPPAVGPKARLGASWQYLLLLPRGQPEPASGLSATSVYYAD